MTLDKENGGSRLGTQLAHTLGRTLDDLVFLEIETVGHGVKDKRAGINL